MLGLRPGELVEIKSKDKIVRILDVNTGIATYRSTPEMLRYCGCDARGRQRVHKIIDEKGGAWFSSNSCIMLEEIVCTGTYHGYFPYAIYPYWREIWIE